MSDSLRLLGLQDALKEEIQRHVAHIFAGFYSFQAAWDALKVKYGVPDLVIQAHNQHLLQIPAFKSGDFDSLFNMATAVCDAVSGVDAAHVGEFTYSTVVQSLHGKLPPHLQTDWGKYAYALKRVPSLVDLNVWIDTVLGGEELRGAKLSSSSDACKPPSQLASFSKPAKPYVPSASSSYYRGPTVLSQSVSNDDYRQCQVCQESPGHRLEMCNVFKRMLVNVRAAFCAENNHCFKCLTNGHYAAKCRFQNAACRECNGQHHTMLHGADRQFPPTGKNGKSKYVLAIRIPQTGVRPVLLTLVNVNVEAGSTRSQGGIRWFNQAQMEAGAIYSGPILGAVDEGIFA